MAFVILCTATASAHDGPPFPIVSDRVAGAYRLSIWTDPDTTDDGSAGGQFWLVIEAADRAVALPADTRGRVSIAPIGHEGASETGPTAPVSDPGRQFVALRINREGRYAVRAEVEGPLGPAVVEGDVDATYDLRPPPALIAVYLMPFVLAGALWLKVPGTPPGRDEGPALRARLSTNP